MKKGLMIGTAILLCFSMLTGCAHTQGDTQNTEPGSTLVENVMDSYTKLISFKTEDCAQQSVKDFNARLLPEFGELLDAQAVVANAGLSAGDENYDFVNVTMYASLGELYAEQMDEKVFYSGYAKKGRLSEPLNKTEEAIFEAEGPVYDFLFTATYYLEYEILSPDTLTIAERDNAFRTFGTELQAYVDSLSEAELADKSIKEDLSNRAAEILQKITPDGMVISCEIQVDSNDEELMFDDSFSDEEYQMLLALKLDGYEDMPVSKFQNKVWTLTDTTEYRDLLERFSKSGKFYGRKDHDEATAFYFYVLEPLTAEKWQSWSFSDTITPEDPELSYRTFLEYVLTLHIINADALTVGEYNNTRLAAIQAFQDFISTRTEETLMDSSAMEKAIDNEIEKIRQELSNDGIQVDVEYSFMPLDFYEDADGNLTESEQEIRQTAYGTKEDYDSLLALKTPDYADMTVADFNLKLLGWADGDYERMERMDADYAWNDYQVDLSDDELSFVRLTIQLSGQENGKRLLSLYTGNPEADPVYEEYLPQKLTKGKENHIAWCDLFYQFSYHIADKETVTVGERDRCVGGMIRAVQEFWNETQLDDLLKMTKQDIVSRLTSMAAECSNDEVAVIITSDWVYFESVDERVEKY